MKWSTKENERLASLYKSGMTNVDIGQEMGVTTKAVERQIAKIRTEYGLVGRPRKYSSKTEARLAVNRQARERYVHRPKKQNKRTDHPNYSMWQQAKHRAKEQGVPFDLELDDIVIPELCPLLEIPLIKGKGTWSDNSPTLDKIIPSEGYVRGNIQVISFRANRIKMNASIEELELIARNLRKYIS
jgi:hypothetical protein